MKFTYRYRDPRVLCAWNFYPFGGAICSDCCSCAVDIGVGLGFDVVDALITGFVALNVIRFQLKGIAICSIDDMISFKCGHIQSAGCRLFPHLKCVW